MIQWYLIPFPLTLPKTPAISHPPRSMIPTWYVWYFTFKWKKHVINSNKTLAPFHTCAIIQLWKGKEPSTSKRSTSLEPDYKQAWNAGCSLGRGVDMVGMVATLTLPPHIKCVHVWSWAAILQPVTIRVFISSTRNEVTPCQTKSIYCARRTKRGHHSARHRTWAMR